MRENREREKARASKCPIAVRHYKYGVATISRLLKIIGFFCKKAL